MAAPNTFQLSALPHKLLALSSPLFLPAYFAYFAVLSLAPQPTAAADSTATNLALAALSKAYRIGFKEQRREEDLTTSLEPAKFCAWRSN
jgi:hypothetical protein